MGESRGGPSRVSSQLLAILRRLRPSASCSEPMSLVNIELHYAVVAHLQKERLAVVLVPFVNPLHDLKGAISRSDRRHIPAYRARG